MIYPSSGGSLIFADDLHNLSYATNTSYRFSFGEKTWTEIAAMREARMYHCCCVLEGVIYAIGGESEGSRMEQKGYEDLIMIWHFYLIIP